MASTARGQGTGLPAPAAVHASPGSRVVVPPGPHLFSCVGSPQSWRFTAIPPRRCSPLVYAKARTRGGLKGPPASPRPETSIATRDVVACRTAPSCELDKCQYDRTRVVARGTRKLHWVRLSIRAYNVLVRILYIIPGLILLTRG